MAIINNIDDLRQTIKVDVDTPFESWIIFLNDARNQFLVNYLGLELIEKLESINQSSASEADQKYLRLLSLARGVLGPYAGQLAMDELSINTGDQGHTVTKTDRLTPASDSKIAKVASSMLERAWNNLELLLEYLENNISDYPEWKNSRFYANYKTKYFSSAVSFQDAGLIDINYSRLTFEKLRHLIIRLEKSEVSTLITDKVESFIFDTKNTDEDKKKSNLILGKIRAFLGARVGELHTSQTTRIQRSKNNNLEYKAIIRPLYSDESENNLNYYSAQARYWKDEIQKLLPDLGVDLADSKLNWSNKDKKIFSSII